MDAIIALEPFDDLLAFLWVVCFGVEPGQSIGGFAGVNVVGVVIVGSPGGFVRSPEKLEALKTLFCRFAFLRPLVVLHDIAGRKFGSKASPGDQH